MLRERDPAGTRLSDASVIEIHKAHRDGTPWDTIAKQHNTNRKTVARIVNGDRWQRLHPMSAPWLYDDETQETYTLEQIREAARVGYTAFIEALRAANLK